MQKPANSLWRYPWPIPKSIRPPGSGVYEYVALKDYIAALFDRPVDVVSREGLKPYVKPAVTTDAIYAF